MANRIFDRDWLGLKEVKDPSVIIYGNIYAIITSELQIIKYIVKCDKKDTFCLSSENKHYQDFEIPKEKILSLYIVKTILPFSQVKTLI